MGIDDRTGRTVVRIDPKYHRPTEVDILLGDPAKAKKDLGWSPKVHFEELIRDMVTADIEAIKANTPH